MDEIDRLTIVLGCTCGSSATFSRVDGGVICSHCQSSFPYRGDILHLVVDRVLSSATKRELVAYTSDLSMPEIVRYVRHETAELWQNYYTLDRRDTIKQLALLLAAFSGLPLCFLGVGTGREVEYLQFFMGLTEVYCSDLSSSNLKIAKVRLDFLDLQGFYFTSDLNNCPLIDKSMPVIIINALHHTEDMHGVLNRMLKYGYKNIIFLEPTENWLINLLGRANLAIRIEPSGVRPGRLSLKRVGEMCCEHGYSKKVVTSWSFPQDYYQKFGIKGKWFRSIFLSLVKIFSFMTKPFEFGNQSLVHLKKMN